MKFLIDTNIISDSRKTATSPARRWLSAQRESDIQISVITLFELEVGLQRAERKDPRQGFRLRTWLDQNFKPNFKDAFIPVDDQIAQVAANLHVPNPMPHLDGLIAATALVHGLILVTRNVKDFERTEVPLLNPWA